MKKTLAILLLVIMVIVFSGCGDSEYTNKVAYIKNPNGNVIKVDIDKALNIGECVKIIGVDGVTYITSWENILIAKE